ncbi:hypothetical protein AA12717_1469 [Gluconacetobacter sacchari DSM 12717]|uniref:Uncharacterized protein n=2 Tax=Gluconacetobacter sacchari TaxID=92759 RepID=A0A7W4IE64_9PROT|nr:MATE family efflux transporter [Gluconacetobacter sacchari]MBB2161132.1 hypothetical protein [Gluconacetobacter sacchari]GBQ23355.1 hypothetical protein AA12717_1469 [Gluconacetobacter sacchari DSM 12717]
MNPEVSSSRWPKVGEHFSQTPRAKKIAWIGTYIGAGFAEIIGLGIALAPSLWVGLFTEQAPVSDFATTYLIIVAPTYGFMATGFVFAFSAQGAGHVVWPFLAYTIRTLIAAGGGILAVQAFHAGMAGIAVIVAVSYVIFAPICGIAMLSKTVWEKRTP